MCVVNGKRKIWGNKPEVEDFRVFPSAINNSGTDGGWQTLPTELHYFSFFHSYTTAIITLKFHCRRRRCSSLCQSIFFSCKIIFKA